MFYEMEDVVTVKEGLADRFGAERIVTAPGCCILDRDQEFLPFKGTKLSGAKEREDLGNRSDEELLEEAASLAAEADTVILTLSTNISVPPFALAPAPRGRLPSCLRSPQGPWILQAGRLKKKGPLQVVCNSPLSVITAPRTRSTASDPCPSARNGRCRQ